MNRVLRWLRLVLALQVLVALPLMLLRFALGAAGLTRVDPASNDIRMASLGEGFVLRSEAPALSGGSVAWMMGGVVLDLRGATLSPQGAFLQVATVMGGTEVIVPPEWSVDLDQRAVMGGAARPLDEGSGPVLRIKALTLMGGMDVVRRAPGDLT